MTNETPVAPLRKLSARCEREMKSSLEALAERFWFNGGRRRRPELQAAGWLLTRVEEILDEFEPEDAHRVLADLGRRAGCLRQAPRCAAELEAAWEPSLKAAAPDELRLMKLEALRDRLANVASAYEELHDDCGRPDLLHLRMLLSALGDAALAAEGHREQEVLSRIFEGGFSKLSIHARTWRPSANDAQPWTFDRTSKVVALDAFRKWRADCAAFWDVVRKFARDDEEKQHHFAPTESR